MMGTNCRRWVHGPQRAGQRARLCYAGHVQMDNRHGLVVNTRLTQASGIAEPMAALAMAAEIAGQGQGHFCWDVTYSGAASSTTRTSAPSPTRPAFSVGKKKVI